MQDGLKKKINIAFFFEKFGTWEGEKNYLYSLISAVDEYSYDDLKINIITSKKLSNYFKSLKLKNTKIIESRFFETGSTLNYFRKVLSKIFNKFDPLILYYIKKYKVDLISHYTPFFFCKTICWTPDFQHIHLTENFSEKEIARRNKLYNNIIDNADLVLLSSKNSINDLKKYTKKKINYKKLNFVPKINLDIIKKKNIKKKYNLKKYFIVPNQFWKHKNHIILAKSIAKLKNKNFNFKIVLTGDSISQNGKFFFFDFMREIKKKKLESYFVYLGRVPYADLICLIDKSHSVINPSFFEGWSTSVEEAKILNKIVILSNIKVHKEQNPKMSYYFDPKNSNELSKKIYQVSKIRSNKFKKFDFIKKNYIIDRIKFAKNYAKIVKELYYI